MDIVTQRYKDEAKKWGDSACSTMDDEIIRQRETEQVTMFIAKHVGNSGKSVMDIGCGNGYTLQVISQQYPANKYWGVDPCQELLTISRNRKLANCIFIEGNILGLSQRLSQFDVVITQRCLINILNWEDQKKALDEIYRILIPGGVYLMIECFTDGLRNYNKARIECGLSEIKELPFNRYLDKEGFLAFIEGKFKVLEWSNFLSSHYFISRVLHALVTKGDQIKNSEFIKFFSYLPPIGNYSPLQAYILRRV